MVEPLLNSQIPAQIADNDSAHQAAPVLDTSVFQELLETLACKLELVVSIYGTFLRTAVTLIGSLPDQDCAAQVSTLHTLKGSASMLGANRLARLASSSQQLVTNGAEPLMKTHIEELASELDIFRSALSSHAHSLGYRSEI